MRKGHSVTIEPREAYDELIRRSRELATLASCSAVLGWDEQTYMPTGGAAHRGNQMAILAGLHHERATDPRIGELLAIVEGSALAAGQDSVEAANIRELRRSYDRRVRLPKALVEELARTTSMAQSEWVPARAASDFPRFRPWLEKIVQLKREESACLAGLAPADGAAGSAASAYDPLLDEYEPGARSADLAVLFDALRRELTPLVAAIGDAAARKSKPGSIPGSDSSADEAEGILKRSYPRDRQRIFGEAVAAAVGFDFRRGRLDVTAHPFCTGIGPGDCRITTRFDEHEFSDAFFGILHEVGHGLYEQGLDEAHHGTPMGEAVSLGVHESQSRLWENLVGRGRAFWAYWLPMARRVFHEALADVSLDRFHAAVNHVSPSLIRVRADEATYNLHIIVRFELEQALLAGDLAVGRPPRGLESEVPGMPGRHPGQRRRGLPPGHPLECRADRLFPDLHAGQHLRGPALRRRPGPARRPRRRLRPRRFRRPARLAPREGPSPWSAIPGRRPGRARHRLTARPPPADRRPAREVCRALWNLTTRLVPSP